MDLDDAPPGKAAHWWLTIALIVGACLPALVFRFLPMTDLPQHVAMASIIEHHDDPSYGFASYYDVASPFERPSYALVYLIARIVGAMSSPHFAMNVVAFLSILAYPLGLLALLRAARKPPWLALLAVPLIFHRTVFWGFASFDLAVGLALASFAFHIDPRKTVRRDVAQAVLALAAITTHVYGLALLAALVGGYAVFGGWRALRARWWTVAPIIAGAILWVTAMRERGGYGFEVSPSAVDRLTALPAELLGGYADSSESVILCLFVVAWVALVWPSLPVSRERLRALTTIERIAYASFVGNLVVYFVAPTSTYSAKYINVRHLFLAFAFLPLIARAVDGRASMLRRAGPAIAAVAALANSWVHLMAFDREARPFQQIVDAMPAAPKIVFMDFDPNGKIMKSYPYVHFMAYIQAEKGGMVSSSFPMLFWNVPVKMRADAGVPTAPQDFEWNPMLYGEKQFGYFYDYALLRMPYQRIVKANPNFPYELVMVLPPWQLYRRSKP